MTDIYPIKPFIIEGYKLNRIIIIVFMILFMIILNLIAFKKDKKHQIKDDRLDKLKEVIKNLDKLDIESKNFYTNIYEIILELLEVKFKKKFKDNTFYEIRTYIDNISNSGFYFNSKIINLLEKIYLHIYKNIDDNLEERKRILQQLKETLAQIKNHEKL